MAAARIVTVNDRMQQGYRYTLTEPQGQNFDPEFRPELTPKEMLALGVFGGKYLTDCRDEFPASRFRFGGKKAGSTPTIRAAGSNGIAAITAAGAWPTTRGRSSAGRRSAATSARSSAIAGHAIIPAGPGNARPCCTGPMTAGRFEPRD